MRRFIEEGARVAFADRDADRGNRVASELEAQGAVAHFVEADMGKEADATGFIEAAVARFGRLDVLVNNAGIRKYQPVTKASKESWDEMLAVNLLSCAICARAAIPVMAAGGGGAIVNVASIRSLIAGSEWRAVRHHQGGGARPHPLHGARPRGARGAGQRGGPGPDLHAVPRTACGDARTGPGVLHRGVRRGDDVEAPGHRREIANGIAFLASDEASYITGTCLFIDGGQTAL